MSFESKKEAARKKSLGELGELFAIKSLVDAQYDKIRNLNDDNMNEAYADIYCEKDGKKYIIRVKARNKYQKNGDKYYNNFPIDFYNIRTFYYFISDFCIRLGRLIITLFILNVIQQALLSLYYLRFRFKSLSLPYLPLSSPFFSYLLSLLYQNLSY